MIYVYVCGIPGLLIIAILLWLMTSVGRGTKKVNNMILDRLNVVGEKLSRGKTIEPAEVRELAKTHSTRPMLYEVLKHFEKLDLFPQEYLSREAQGQGQLAYWLLHPNELQEDPEDIEYVKTLTRELEGEPASFYIYKYRMRADHWAGKDGWLLGFAGPYFDASVPYEATGAFSKVSDRFEEASPDELVDWFIGLNQKKS